MNRKGIESNSNKATWIGYLSYLVNRITDKECKDLVILHILEIYYNKMNSERI
uniref:Uncharacterized protein n=1 Tax=Rhizophagus irregularis (strain DAOM 181602 / DAOM 197198 / MUCL 43194) TaxID=747089 RepID=U9UUN6_RHIID